MSTATPAAPARRVPAAGHGAYARTGILVRSALRRDWVLVAVWVLGFVAIYAAQVSSARSLYADQADLDAAARTLAANPAIIALTGPARALDSLGGITAWKLGSWGALAAGLMGMLLVGQHTRAEEDSGRLELVRAAGAGRRSPVASALVVAATANVAVALGILAALIGQGLAVCGSAALAVGAAATGILAAALTAVVTELVPSVGAAYGITGAVLGLAFVLRAIGDAAAAADGSDRPTWLSRIGWAEQLRPYAGERWWPLALTVAVIICCTTSALVLQGRRDLGAALATVRTGPARAAERLTGVGALAWRLARPGLVGWSVGSLLLGAAYGSIATSIRSIVTNSDSAVSRLVAQSAGDILDSFVATTCLAIGLLSTAYAVGAALKLRHDEAAGLTEAVLATGVSRYRSLGARASTSLLGVVLVVLAGAIGNAVTVAVELDDPGAVGRLTGSALVQLPAIWVVGALTLLLVAGLPRAASALAWAVLAWSVLVTYFGSVLRLPGWLRDTAPFRHTPLLPAQEFRLLPVVLLLLVAGVLLGAAFVAFRRRDVPST